MAASSSAREGGEPNEALRALDSVHGPTGGLPQVVRRTRTERRLVRDDAGVTADPLRTSRVTQEVRIVTLLPDEDHVRRRHELGDEGASWRGTGERVRGHAVPAAVVRT